MRGDLRCCARAGALFGLPSSAQPTPAEAAYGNDPNGGAKRKDQGEEGRWRYFTRDQIKARNDNLDISWLRDTEAESEEQLTEPEDIAAAIIGHLKAALEEIEELSEELEPDSVAEAAAAVEAAE